MLPEGLGADDKEKGEGVRRTAQEAQVVAQNKLNNLSSGGEGMEKERPEGDVQPLLRGVRAEVGE